MLLQSSQLGCELLSQGIWDITKSGFPSECQLVLSHLILASVFLLRRLTLHPWKSSVCMVLPVFQYSEIKILCLVCHFSVPAGHLIRNWSASGICWPCFHWWFFLCILSFFVLSDSLIWYWTSRIQLVIFLLPSFLLFFIFLYFCSVIWKSFSVRDFQLSVVSSSLFYMNGKNFAVRWFFLSRMFLIILSLVYKKFLHF